MNNLRKIREERENDKNKKGLNLKKEKERFELVLEKDNWYKITDLKDNNKSFTICKFERFIGIRNDLALFYCEMGYYTTFSLIKFAIGDIEIIKI